VPPWGREEIARAARLIRPIGRAEVEAWRERFGDVTARPVAGFRVDEYTILLVDGASAHECDFLWLYGPGEGARGVMVQACDPWNPPDRTVIDGDAFAFRRFISWLRAGIIAGGHDHVLVDFCPQADVDGVVRRGAVPVTASEWLTYDEPDHGDEFLLDWRIQLDIVSPVEHEDWPEEGGGTGGRALYRAFLAEVIDPRFASYDLASSRGVPVTPTRLPAT
jgi:hypothetical protein